MRPVGVSNQASVASQVTLRPALKMRVFGARLSSSRNRHSPSPSVPIQSEPSDAAVAQLGLVIEHVRSAADRGPLFEENDLARLEAPVFIIAGERDVIFPGAAAIERAREVLPNVRHTLLLPDANHSSPDVFAPSVLERIDAFLSEDDASR